MAQVELVVSHPQLFSEVTMTVDRSFWEKTTHVPRSRTAFVMLFKSTYEAEHNRKLNFIDFNDLVITETLESQQQPHGCSCECAGCDDQGWHCHKQAKGCYM